MSIRRTFLCGVRQCRRRITVRPDDFWEQPSDRTFYCWECSAMGTHFNPRKRKRIAIVARNVVKKHG